MFKKSSKNIISIISILFVIQAFRQVYGGFLSLEDGVQKAANAIQRDKFKSNTSAIQGDLFLSLYENNESGPQRTSSINAINDVRKNILNQNKNQCQISNNDILVILREQSDFRKDMYSNDEIPLSTYLSIEGSVENSCNKVLYCYGGDKALEINTRKEIENCKSIVYENYKIRKSLGEAFLSQPSSHQYDSIYMDGDRNNASFDLLGDIEDIKTILFQSNDSPVIPKMIYYTMPSVTIPAGNNNNTNNNGSDTNNNAGNSLNGDNTLNNNTNTNNTDLSSLAGQDTEESLVDLFIQSNQALDSIVEGVGANMLGKESNIQAPLCPLPDSSAIIIPESIGDDSNEIEKFNDVQSDLFDALSGLLFQPPSANDTVGLGNFLGNTIVGGANSLENRLNEIIVSKESQQCSLQCEDKASDIEKQICEGNCCLTSCNSFSNAGEKAICISQCLCGEVASKNDIVRIKFCRVPAEPSRIIANKKVSTIEEVVDAINSIFLYLKNNGLMLKRTKTKEFFDSSFSDIKFSEIISFDIFVAFKPIYDTISFTSLKEKKNTENKKIQQAIHPLGMTLGDKQDKAKYVVIGNHARSQAEKSIYDSFNQFNDNVRNQSKIYCEQLGKTRTTNNNGLQECTESYSTLDKQNTKNQEKILKISTNEETIAILNDSVYQFIDQNSIVWEQIGDSINDMLMVSNRLKDKAQNAE